MDFVCLNLYTTDPALNLAAEQYVFDHMPRDKTYCMLWQNHNAVIVGKYQNTLAEINESFVREHGIRVIRRLSGGGAVYHDLGNLNFTFITDARDIAGIDFSLFCRPVIRTLAALGVKAELSGRNDMTIDGKKFSGNSQYIRQGRVMHHGTILFDSNLYAVFQALQAKKNKFQSKGVKSVRSRVTNVAEHLPQNIPLEEFRQLLLSNIIGGRPCTQYRLTQRDLDAIDSLRNSRYATREWNYGFSPKCTIHCGGRVEGCGQVDIDIAVEHGLISQMYFHGDFFSLKEPAELASHFIGHPPDSGAYAAIIGGCNISQYFVGLSNSAFLNMLSS